MCMEGLGIIVRIGFRRSSTTWPWATRKKHYATGSETTSKAMYWQLNKQTCWHLSACATVTWAPSSRGQQFRARRGTTVLEGKLLWAYRGNKNLFCWGIIIQQINWECRQMTSGQPATTPCWITNPTTACQTDTCTIKRSSTTFAYATRLPRRSRCHWTRSTSNEFNNCRRKRSKKKWPDPNITRTRRRSVSTFSKKPKKSTNLISIGRGKLTMIISIRVESVWINY